MSRRPDPPRPAHERMVLPFAILWLIWISLAIADAARAGRLDTGDRICMDAPRVAPR